MTVRTLVLITIAAAVLLVAGCAPSAGGNRVAVVETPPSTARPGPAGDPRPYPIRGAAEGLSATTSTSAVHVPPARASRSRTTARPRAAVPQPAPRPAVVPTPEPAPAGECGPGTKSRSLSDRCWGSLLAKYNWAGGLAKALAVLYCESRGNQDAVGPRYVDGKGHVHYPHSLLQVMDGPFDPEANIAAAWGVYSERERRGKPGWSAWSCA